MTTTSPSNRDLRDEIRDYWSDRAATFDNDPGHKISEGAELVAWANLFRRHLGAAHGRKLLDLASGTGEIALLCKELGFAVTGLDWAEPMLARARAKAPEVTFLQADAEQTMLPDASFDVIVTRHLVWTLVNPQAAFAEWRRILKPGGKLLIVDGDFVSRSWLTRMIELFSGSTSHGMVSRHQDIVARVYFNEGARSNAVADLLVEAGFENLHIDTGLGEIHQAQAHLFGWRKSLLRRSEHRYAISASAPGTASA